MECSEDYADDSSESALSLVDNKRGSKSSGVTIEVEHAYATNTDTVSQEEDPLKLPEIKTEIKMEHIEIKQEETESHQPEYWPETNYDENMDTSLCNVPLSSSVSAYCEKYIPFNVESIPKDVYMELQDKYKNNMEQLSNANISANASVERLTKENVALKAQISKLKKQQRKVDSSINKKSEIFFNDLQKMNEKHMDLRKEMESLRDENVRYKKRLYDCSSSETSDALEKNINELKKRALNFVDLERQAITNIKILKNEMDKQEKENRTAKLKLTSTIKLLAEFQKHFAKRNVNYFLKSNTVRELQVNIKKMLEDHKAKAKSWSMESFNLKVSLKQVNDLNAQLKNDISVSKASSKALEMSAACRVREISDLKKCLHVASESIKNKDCNLKKAKAELDNLKSSISEKDNLYMALRENFEKKVKENNHEVIKSRQKLIEYKKYITQKSSECEILKANIKELEEEIQRFKTKSCDYCGL